MLCMLAMPKIFVTPSLDPKNYTASKWIYILAKVFGYWPFPSDMTNRRQSNSMRLSKGNVIWSAALALSYATSIASQTSTETLERWHASRPDAVLTRTTNAIFLLTLIVSIVLNVLNRHALRKIDVINLDFDEKVQCSPSSIEKKNICRK